MKMFCDRMQDRIADLVSNVLTDQERAEVLEHLDGCPGCQKYFLDLHHEHQWVGQFVETLMLQQKTKVEASLNGWVESKTMRSNIWRGIMKNKIMKLTVAAAIVIAVVGLSYWLNGSVDGANAAFAQMLAAVRKVPCLAIVETRNVLRQKTPQTQMKWICFDAKKRMGKKQDGGCYLYDYASHEYFDYSPETGKIQKYELKPENLLEWESPSDLIAQLLVAGNKTGSTLSRKEEMRDGHLLTVFNVTVMNGNERENIRLCVDAKSNLPLTAEVRHYEGDVNADNADIRFEYPEKYPGSLYDLGVPQSVQIVSPTQRIIRGQLVDERGVKMKGCVDFGLEKPVNTNELGEFSYSLPHWFKETTRPRIGYAFNMEKTLGQGFFWKMKSEEELIIVLQPLTSFTGRVVDARELGVDDAEVWIWVVMPDGGGWTNLTNVPWKLVKEGNGYFKFEGVPKGLPMDVHAEKPGLQGRQSAGGSLRIVLKPLPGYEEETPWNATLTGRVIDEKGNPVPGVEVGVVIGTKTFRAPTNSKGSYVLEGLPNGKKINGSVYLDGYGHTMFETICEDRNFDIQLLPQGFELYGKPSPGLFAEKWFNSQPVTLEQYRGKVILLQVGVYLQAGTGDIEKMQGLQKKYGEKGLVVISLHHRLENLDWAGKMTEEQIADFVKTHNIDFPFGLDAKVEAVRDRLPSNKQTSNGATYSLYGVKAIPALYLIDKKGIVRISPPQHELNEWIERLLAE